METKNNDSPTPGERIAEIRSTYSVSREDLAERSGVSLAMLKQIEEEGLIPDLAPLLKISRALGVRLGTLLDDREELGPVVSRAGNTAEASRFKTGLTEADKTQDSHGLTFFSLSADKSGRHMEPFLIDVSYVAVQDKKPHEGEEFIFVMRGRLQIDYGKDTYILEAGDSIYYDSIVPHSVHAADSEGAQILAVIYAPA
jgi:transcriptional regulator with XRE-family HTH domain